MVKSPCPKAYAWLAMPVLAGLACQPEFAERSSAVTGLRVLAIEGDPAEVPPRAMAPTMHYHALVVDAAGPRDDVALDWAFCTEPRPVNELNDVSQACLQRQADWLLPLAGSSSTASGPLPANGCRQFGPNPPEPKDGGMLGRPADPDSTGGYYQPVRVLSADGLALQAVGQTRLHCDLAGATADVLREFSLRYRDNANPAIDGLFADSWDQMVPPDGPGVSPWVVTVGSTQHFGVHWAMCDPNVPCPPDVDTTGECPEPEPCTGAESYVLYDLQSRQLVERREAMRLSWFATAGSFTNDSTGRTAEEYPAVDTGNDWTAPTTPGEVHLWIVLRDSRGGVAWNAYRIEVQ